MGTWSLDTALRLLTPGIRPKAPAGPGLSERASPLRPLRRPRQCPPGSPGGERGSSAVGAGTLRCLRVPDAGGGAAEAGWTQTPAARKTGGAGGVSARECVRVYDPARRGEPGRPPLRWRLRWPLLAQV